MESNRIRGVVLAMVGAAGLGACDVDPGGPGTSGTWPIVDGTRELGEPAVVVLYHDWGAMCSATAISSRVVVTAKHCVQGLPASGFHVLVGSSVYATTADYGVTATRMTPGRSLENSDIAVVLLAEDFGYPIKRWEFAPWPRFLRGATITAIGFGQTIAGDGGSAGTKYRRDGRVTQILGTTEFVTQGENACQGDSGGPVLFQDVLTGVVSRGEAGCTGFNLMTRVSGFTDLIVQALRDTGGCVPAGFEVCNGLDDDCWDDIDDDVPNCACANGGVAGVETCNGIDDDCNVAIDDLPNCACTGGAAPGTEACNGTDDDCDGEIDEGCSRLGEPCADGSVCVGGLCMDLGAGLVCTAPCAPGRGPACPDGGYCEGTACAEGGLCHAARTGGAAQGTPCSSNGECASRFCALNPVTEAGVCSAACTPGTSSCDALSSCLAVTGDCGACFDASTTPAPRGFGEPCATDADCLSGYCFTDGPPGACDGGYCPFRYCAVACAGGCPAGSHCRDEICVRGEPGAAGDTCVADADCSTGLFCVDLGDLRRCVALCPDGSGCPADTACVDAVCWPTAFLPGDPCSPGGECEGGSCVSAPDGPICAAPCIGATDCPSGLACVPAPDGAGFVCMPPDATGAANGSDGCGCSVAGAASFPPSAGFALLAALAAVTLRRRRRSS